MPEYDDQTIGALCTAAGGAVAVIRLSGPRALEAASALWRPARAGAAGPGAPSQRRRLLLGRLYDAPEGTLLDGQCLAVYMPGPASYTGEDVTELHLHGGPVAVRLALEALARLGVRPALPGEFTRRAFLNGKLDLTQAEAVAELVGASSTAALALANRQLEGQLGTQVNDCYDRLQLVLSEIESRLDFPEEELEWQPLEELAGELSRCRERLLALAATRREGEVLRGGVSLAIAGAPNVGKSSLLNRLLGRQRAIVSAIPGTTRDTVEADCVIRQIPFRIIDTAGIRRSDDTIEQAGVQRSQEAVAAADVVLWLMDASLPREEAMPFPGWPHRGRLVVAANKCDVPGHQDIPGAVPLSALDGTGLEELYDALAAAVFGGSGISGELAVSARHADLLEAAAGQLETATGLLVPAPSQEEISKNPSRHGDCNPADGHLRDEAINWVGGGGWPTRANAREAAAPPWELAAVALRAALAALGEITGREVSPDVLDTIFHRFCIGK